MTLHWWMHWFWVTSLVALLSVTHSHSRAIPLDTLMELRDLGATDDTFPPSPSGERRAKAIYIQSKPSPPPVTSTTPQSKLFLESQADRKSTPEQAIINTSEVTINQSVTTERPMVNMTTPRPRDNLTKHETVVASTTHNESDSVVTDLPWSVETTLGEFPESGDLVQASEPAGRINEEAGMRAGAVAGLTVGAAAAAALAGAAAFLLYRRRYLNKPQTLNDKCSNPDSTGYLDDSTIRENSEEMYSLDNDSFLNSLEAMTIQNYWTESVKHSKL